MKFEEALNLMRSGAKITHPCFEEDIYFMACRVSCMGEDLGASIVKMKGEHQHPDMIAGSIDDMFYPGTFIPKEEVFEKPCKHGRKPQLDLFLVMSDEWSIYE